MQSPVMSLSLKDACVHCNNLQGIVPSGRRSVNATLRITWKGDVTIDDPNRLTGIIIMFAMGT